MTENALIIKKRLGRLNNDPGSVSITLDAAGETLTISSDGISHDVTVVEPTIAADRLVKALLLSRNVCTKNGVESQGSYMPVYAEQGPWAVTGLTDGWYTATLFYLKRYTYDPLNEAPLLAEMETDTEDGSVIAYCYQGTCKYYRRLTASALTVLPHVLDNTEWQEATFSDWSDFARVLLTRSGASTTVGEFGMQQLLLTPNSENALYDLAIADASCMSCCEQVTEFGVLWTRLYAARALFCRESFSEAAKLVEALDLECKKIEDCSCCG